MDILATPNRQNELPRNSEQHNKNGNGWLPDADLDKMSTMTIGSKHHVRILVLYTGGTIGMVRTALGVYEPVKNIFEERIRKVSQLHDKSYVKKHFVPKTNDWNPLVLPDDTSETRQVIYYVHEYEPLLDSSNMSMDDYVRIAEDIKKFYDKVDGFVVLHGTDTLSYTASALSFMLENLGKPVVITGSQIPIFEPRTDGRDNFQGAILLAGRYLIPEVSVYFNQQLFRGNRTTKLSADELDAFGSPNMRPLVKMGINIEVDWKSIIAMKPEGVFQVETKLCRNVALLRLFPSITTETVRAYLQHPMQGVVLQTYGAGNFPSHRTDLLQELKTASDRGVIIVNITQCLRGSVTTDYETGLVLQKAGIVSGADMTLEAALAKLSYVLAKSCSNLEKKMMMQSNLRGELKVDKDVDSESSHALSNFVNALEIYSSSKDNHKYLGKVLFPFYFYIASLDCDVQRLELLRHYGGEISCSDWEGRTALHAACSQGNVAAVEFLLANGANAEARDRFQRTPIDLAINGHHLDVVRLLRKTGACVSHSAGVLVQKISSACIKGQLCKLEGYKAAGVNFKELGRDHIGRTPLHYAVMNNHVKCIQFLILEGDVDMDIVDDLGFSPGALAKNLGLMEAMIILSNANKHHLH